MKISKLGKKYLLLRLWEEFSDDRYSAGCLYWSDEYGKDFMDWLEECPLIEIDNEARKIVESLEGLVG